ncbi:MAG TPA: hypothetical protein VL652_34885 [Kutzneria sp.]|nr:hypothetical protein [Kutzneria sp.]
MTTRARAMPVDAEPVAGGTISVEAAGGTRPLARVLGVAQQFGRRNLHTSHFASCPEAASWRTSPRARS